MIFYHGTAAIYADKIKREGLVPRAGKGADEYAIENLGWDFLTVLSLQSPAREGVYISPNAEAADWFARMAAKVNNSKPVVFKLDIPEPEVRQNTTHDIASGGSVPGSIYHGTIPPVWIKGEVEKIHYRFGKPVAINGGYDTVVREDHMEKRA